MRSEFWISRRRRSYIANCCRSAGILEHQVSPPAKPAKQHRHPRSISSARSSATSLGSSIAISLATNPLDTDRSIRTRQWGSDSKEMRMRLCGAIIPSDEANPDSNRGGSSFVAQQAERQEGQVVARNARRMARARGLGGSGAAEHLPRRTRRGSAGARQRRRVRRAGGWPNGVLAAGGGRLLRAGRPEAGRARSDRAGSAPWAHRPLALPPRTPSLTRHCHADRRRRVLPSRANRARPSRQSPTRSRRA